MDMIAFARLISFISVTTDSSFNMSDIEVIKNQVEECTKTNSDTAFIGKSEVSSLTDTMLRGMRDGKRIEAIKACRELTGLGLKDSKDLIEAAMHDND